MKQPTKTVCVPPQMAKKTNKALNATPKKPYAFRKKNFKHKEYGTSKLEQDFAREFLDKNGIQYIYQYHAKEIGRYFDFAIVTYSPVHVMEVKDGIECVKQDGQSYRIEFLIEVDGSYYHGDSRLVSEDKLSPMQKHNKFVDKLKDEYAGLHCIPIMRIWELDIRNNPKMVLDNLGKYIKMGQSNTKKKTKLNEKNFRTSPRGKSPKENGK